MPAAAAFDEAHAAKAAIKSLVENWPDVVGVGIGTARSGTGYAVHVHLRTASAGRRIPDHWGSVPVEKDVVGDAVTY